MEELKTNSDLQSLKLQIQQMIDMYNVFSKDEQISLTIARKNQDKINEPEKVDIRKYFVCNYATKEVWVGDYFPRAQYAFDSVGLFEKIHDSYDENKRIDGYYFMGCWEKPYDYVVRFDHQVYFGINSDQVAIYRSGSDNGIEAKKPGYTATLSDGRQVSATCVIDKAYSFDSIRLRLYQDGDIGPYEIGKATNAEILEVLTYAQKMFSEENAKQRKKC